jgi:KTSC domain-containing protein
MKRQQVESSMLRGVGYDSETRTLEIEFTSGQVYEYHDVPPEVYAGLLRAESLGQYFHENIRDAYSYLRLRKAS